MISYFYKKKYRFCFLVVLFCSYGIASAQNVNLTSQADVNAFNSNTQLINGDLTIGSEFGSDITDLSPLSNLQTIDGVLEIFENENLENIDDLSSLTTIFEHLYIVNNSRLSNINGLSNLSYVGEDIEIISNSILTNINGLLSLSEVLGSMSITDNNELIDINGLTNIIKLDENLDVRSNEKLLNLGGLNNISYISGALIIQDNDQLIDLQGLNSLDSIGASFTIRFNANLVSFEGLDSLIKVGGTISIYRNTKLLDINNLSTLKTLGGVLDIQFNTILMQCCTLDDLVENKIISKFKLSISSNGLGCSSREQIFQSDCGMRLSVATTLPCTGIENGSIQVYVEKYDTIPLNYIWTRQEDGLSGSGSTVESNFLISNLGAGIYDLMVSNVEPDTARRFDIPLLAKEGYIFEVIKVLSTNSSNGLDNGSITIFTAGGNGPYKYTWSGPSQGSESSISSDLYTIPFLVYGEYSIVIEDADGESKVVQVTLLDDEVPVILCEKPMDIIILNDVSSSVDATEYQESKQFYVDFLNEANIGGGDNDSRAAIAEWSGEMEQLVKIEMTGNIAILNDYINSERSFDGGTIPHEALVYGETYLNDNSRADVEKVLILSTDGGSRQISSSLITLADELKAKGYHIITIALGGAFTNDVVREILREIASIDALSPGASAYNQLDKDLAKSIVNNYLCPIDPGSSATAYFDRDGSINIVSIETVEPCPFPEFIEVTIEIAASQELSVPAGIPVTFYQNDPTLFGTTEILTWYLPCAISVGTSETYTVTLPLIGPSNIFAVLNDDGSQDGAIKFKITDIEEVAYSNNIDNERVCVDSIATIQALKYVNSLIPSCDTLVTYDINICNISEIDAFGVQVADVPPNGFILLSTVFNDNGCATDLGGSYNLPADCCFSLSLTYDAASAEYGMYDDQGVILGGPTDQIYINFNGALTTEEDLELDGSIDCPSIVIEFVKSANLTESCDDGFIEYSFTINNELNIPLQGLTFTDVLPSPCTWVFRPYRESGLSISNVVTSGSEITFTIDKVEANTEATFSIDANLGSWEADGTLSNIADLENIPDFENGGFKTLSSNTTITQITTAPIINAPDTIIVNSISGIVTLEAILESMDDVSWSTEGDGAFGNTQSAETVYTFGAQDLVNGEVALYVSLMSDCNETGKSIVILMVDCTLNIEIENIGDCNQNGTPTDGTDDTYELTFSAMATNHGQDSTFVMSIDLVTDTFIYLETYTITLPADGVGDTLFFADNDVGFCFDSVLVSQEVCVEECILTVENLIIGNCNNEGTPFTVNDDTYEVDFSIIGENTGAENTCLIIVENDTLGIYPYNEEVIITLAADGLPDTLTMIDNGMDSCIVQLITNQESCKDTCIMEIIELLEGECNDNDTPDVHDDDTYAVNFSLVVDSMYTAQFENEIFGPFESSVLQSITLPADGEADTLIFTSTVDESCILQEIFNMSHCIAEPVIDTSIIHIPNIFSPNGDGVNDSWSVVILNSTISITQCQIFDRWGSIVYQSESSVPPFWDGKVNGISLSEGVYVYKIIYIENGVDIKIELGDITIIR